MFTRIKSFCIHGLKVHSVDVEVDTGRGMPGMVIVGLAGKATMESRDRVKTALQNSKVSFPRARVTVNLAPGDLKKEGPLFDLPIAMGVMVCTKFLKVGDRLKGYSFVGELTLDGRLRPVHGVLRMAQELLGHGALVIAVENYREAKMVDGLEVIPVAHLNDVVDFFNEKVSLATLTGRAEEATLDDSPKISTEKDYSEVKGQNHAKRALTIAAAGMHNVLMIGPPGSGKSMLAERFSGILAAPSNQESLEIAGIYSVAGLMRGAFPKTMRRPFRAPHHTISDVALIGGGADAKPGEVSLAHRGVLFMDELPEFNRSTLEVLRQPLESGSITIGRARQVCEYPSRFTFIAAMNPCPCGYSSSSLKSCRCTPQQVDRYRSKISGPLLDRIDIHLEVNEQSPSSLRRSSVSGPSTQDMAEVVDRAQKRQAKRYESIEPSFNAELKGKNIEEFCLLDKESEDLLVKGMEELGLSNRAYHKVLLIARTIADIENCEAIEINHVVEALNFRVLDQKFF